MEKELKQQKKILEDRGYNVAYLCVYGSQNYGMALDTPEYKSDIDMKAVIIPSLDDLINETKPISTSIETEWGLCDLKDIRQYCDNICKANPVYIESLYTNYYIAHHVFEEIRALRKELVFGLSSLFVRGALGQMRMKREALCHPYPSIKEKVEKYGYDPKQLHHIARLYDLIRSFNPRYSREPEMNPEEETKKYLLSLKTDVMPVDAAIELADYTLGHAEMIVDCWEYPQDFTIKDKVKEISRRIVKDTILSQSK